MSSKSRVARTIRDAENLQNCNNILKSRGMPYNNEIFNQLEKTHAQYEEKYAMLKKFTAKSKTATKVQARTTEWLEEQNRLQYLAFKVERAIKACLETAIVSSPGLSELHELIQSVNDANADRKSNEKEISSQLLQLKQMMAEVRKANARQSSQGAPTAPSSSSSSSSMASSIIAELLVKLRTSHSQKWAALKEQEEEYTRELNASRNRIMSSLRNDVLTAQDDDLRLELQDIVRQGGGGSEEGGGVVPSVDEFELDMLINEWYGRISALDIAHEAAMRRRDGEKRAYCLEMGLSVPEEGEDPGPLFRLGGWPEADHETFAKIFKKAQVTGMQRKVMTDLMASQLPQHSVDDILQHEEWHRKMKAISGRYRDAEQVYVTQRADLMAETKAAAAALREAQREKAASERELQRSEQYRSELHQKLEVLRLKREELTAAQLQEALQQQELERLREQEAAQAAERERAEKRQLLAEYHAQQAEERREQQERLAEEQREREEEIKRLVEENRPRVEARAQLLAEKEAKQQQRELELIAEDNRRLHLLMKLAEQVPYFEAIQNASSKLDHVTASAKGHEYLKGEDATRGHMPLNGFTDGKVISDSRFRLVSALRAAGVANSDAARIAVQQNFARPHLAIHGIL